MPSFFSSLHRQASLVFPPVGFVLNILLLFLIWFRTPREMWTQCRILVQTCLFDCLFLAVITVATPVPSANYEASLNFYVFRGYFPKQLRSTLHYLSDYYYNNLNEVYTFHSYDYRVLHFHVNLYYALYYFDIFSVCIQVVYRHVCQSLGASIKLSHYVLLLAIAIGIVVTQQLLFASYAAVIQCLPTDNCANFFLFRNTIDSVDTVFLMLTVTSNGFSQVLQFSWVVLLAVTYAIIWNCTQEIIRFVNGHENLNDNLKSLNRQLTYSLIAMAALHFLLICLNLLVTALAAITENPVAIIQDPRWNLKYLVSMLMLSLPVLNPVVCILVNRPYRNAVIAWIFCCCRFKTSSSSSNSVYPSAHNLPWHLNKMPASNTSFALAKFKIFSQIIQHFSVEEQRKEAVACRRDVMEETNGGGDSSTESPRISLTRPVQAQMKERQKVQDEEKEMEEGEYRQRRNDGGKQSKTADEDEEEIDRHNLEYEADSAEEDEEGRRGNGQAEERRGRKEYVYVQERGGRSEYGPEAYEQMEEGAWAKAHREEEHLAIQTGHHEMGRQIRKVEPRAGEGMAEREADEMMVVESAAGGGNTEVLVKFATRIRSRRKSFDRLPATGPLDSSFCNFPLDEFWQQSQK